MKVELVQTPFLTVSEIGELASGLDSLHGRVLKTIERLQSDVDARKAAIAERWKLVDLNLTTAERNRFAEQETSAAIGQIRDAATDEVDAFYKQAGALYNPLVAQRLYYESPVKVLAREALGDERRSAYLQQLSLAGPAELAHFGQFAVGTKNKALGAAVLSRLDALPMKERPFTPNEFATAMELDAYIKAREYLKIGELRFQGLIVAIRTWKQGRSNPINTLSLALRSQQLDMNVLDSLEDDDHGQDE
ncbi:MULTISPECIES: hypothetical protein [Stutzerimonas stutzeri subgroup]|uniref:Uncharacterized protein n=1 Tax=Stutzerimonas stutzeri NF13 TaxID=1212548 RepID=M2VIE4_STUST|nr:MULTISPECIES: hypothetical protein [Stutzerimonas stutzeri subgroup]EMD99747.1 hypothetical protein B381_12538 [Stutzerimonas stutzeri NF13]MBK3880652.1 hypothetical protein [Stutzerimonas stutzeri]MCQ4293900.1 hypothetical protein [Stutzerimonas stutzeri]WOF79946.1 hypothetical protein P5704_005485 [Pseudomonas sp. FeN3W]